jgi:phytoene dehydrogenase-like protein
VPSAQALVIGAGLAGLSAAISLREAGVDAVVIEKSDSPGGRVRSDVIEGFVCDRGFQVFNPWYPTAKKLLDYRALDLKPLDAAVGLVLLDSSKAVAEQTSIDFIGDPIRSLGDFFTTIRAPIGSKTSLVRLATYLAKTAVVGEQSLFSRPDISTMQVFRDLKLDRRLIDNLLKPFLGGVTLDLELTTSRHFTDFVLKSFALGKPSLPCRGMGEISNELANRLPTEAINYQTEVTSISSAQGHPVTVETVRLGKTVSWSADQVVVATDPVTTRRLLPREFETKFGPLRPMQSVTTWYHVADCPSSDLNDGRSSLLLYPQDPSVLINSLVISNAVPSYSPDGRALISTSRLGLHPGPSADEEIKSRVMKIYGCPTKRPTPSFNQIAKYEIENALPNMAPLWPPISPTTESRIFFAGDYTANGSIEGALQSGLTAARQIVGARTTA